MAEEEVKSQPMEFYDYYKNIENGEELIDCRIEILTNLLGPDVPYIIMAYLNAIYSILSESFQLDIFYNAQSGMLNKHRKLIANCQCKIYFNFTNKTKNNEKKQMGLTRIPFECEVLICWEIGDKNVVEFERSKAKISTIFVDKNAKLNVEQAQKYDAEDLKYKQNILMECIVIEFIDKPKMDDIFTTIKYGQKTDWNVNRLWRDQYVIENDALSEYIYTKEEYGPVYYRKGDRWCGYSISDTNLSELPSY